MADEDQIDLSTILPQDPSGRAMAMANALRGKQQRAQDMSILLNNPGAVPGMLNEQAGQGFGMLEKAAERQLKGEELERALEELQAHLSHQRFEEDQSRQRLELEKGVKEKEMHPPVPEAEGSKVSTSGSALTGIQKVKDAFHHAAEVASLAHPLDTIKAWKEYEAVLNGNIADIAGGADPTAKNSEPLMQGFHRRFPDESHLLVPDVADKLFDSLEQSTRDNAHRQVELLKSGPYNRAQVEKLAEGLNTQQTKTHAAPHVVEERKEPGPKGRTLQKMSDGSVRVKP